MYRLPTSAVAITPCREARKWRKFPLRGPRYSAENFNGNDGITPCSRLSTRGMVTPSCNACPPPVARRNQPNSFFNPSVRSKRSKAVNERQAKAELRVRFRLAIPHAGLDPAYSLRPPATRLPQDLPGQEQQLPQQPQLPRQRHPQERRSLSFSPTISSSSQISAGCPPERMRGDGGGLLRAAGREGGGEGERRGERRQQQQQQQHQEQQQQQQRQEGEGYTEPAYITRQRCLVLNDWALSLFETGEYAKVCGAGERGWARRVQPLRRTGPGCRNRRFRLHPLLGVLETAT